MGRMERSCYIWHLGQSLITAALRLFSIDLDYLDYLSWLIRQILFVLLLRPCLVLGVRKAVILDTSRWWKKESRFAAMTVLRAKEVPSPLRKVNDSRDRKEGKTHMKIYMMYFSKLSFLRLSNSEIKNLFHQVCKIKLMIASKTGWQWKHSAHPTCVPLFWTVNSMWSIQEKDSLYPAR